MSSALQSCGKNTHAASSDPWHPLCPRACLSPPPSECGLLITQGHVRGGKSAAYRWIDLAGSNLVLANARFSHPTVLRVGGHLQRAAHAQGEGQEPAAAKGE